MWCHNYGDHTEQCSPASEKLLGHWSNWYNHIMQKVIWSNKCTNFRSTMSQWNPANTLLEGPSLWHICWSPGDEDIHSFMEVEKRRVCLWHQPCSNQCKQRIWSKSCNNSKGEHLALLVGIAMHLLSDGQGMRAVFRLWLPTSISWSE